MTQFSSGKHDHLTADPYPWQHPNGGRIPRRYGGTPFDAWAPRPEFDRPLTNPANPILVRFRILRSVSDPIQAAPEWLRALDAGWYDLDYTKKHRGHARAVLSRLASL